MSSLPQLTVRETATFLLKVFAPTTAKGPIIRRPKVVALAEKLHLDERAIATLTQLAAKYPASPVLLRLPLQREGGGLGSLPAAEFPHLERPRPFGTTRAPGTGSG